MLSSDLRKMIFKSKKDPKSSKILSVAALAGSEDLGLNIVLVVDNSFSMKERKAVEPLLAADKGISGHCSAHRQCQSDPFFRFKGQG